jgi:hypothetical protein
VSAPIATAIRRRRIVRNIRSRVVAAVRYLPAP